MKLKLNNALTASVAMSASAGYIEMGSEFEAYEGDHSGNSFFLPYMAMGVNPIEGSPLSISAKFSQRYMDESDARGSNRARQEITAGYSFDIIDRFTFNPMIRVRHNNYDHSPDGNRETEWRIFPNMSYAINDTFTVALEGFVAPVASRTSADRSVEGGVEDGNFDYTDYKHELEYQLHTRIADDKRLTTSFYNEFSKKDGYTSDNPDAEKKRNEWQLRLVYTQDFGNFTLSPFARITLHRKATSASGETKDEIRNRAGIAGSYTLNEDLSLVSEIYRQEENKRDWDGSHDDKGGTKAYMFYKVGIRYSF